MAPRCDFIAILKYRTTEEGGRKTPAASRYRPAIRFGFWKMFTTGQQIFLDKELVYPGETVTAEIKMILSPCFANTLVEGMQFGFYEGATLIGTGQIIKLVDEKLRYNKLRPPSPPELLDKNLATARRRYRIWFQRPLRDIKNFPI